MILETSTVYLTEGNENLGIEQEEVIANIAISMDEVKYIREMFIDNSICEGQCIVCVGVNEVSIDMSYDDMVDIWKKYKLNKM
jgi:hypothetical protein